MKTVLSICWVAAVCAAAAAAQPSIAALQNNYSFVLPGLPNYGIAQGSIFILYGSNLGPAQVTSQAAPLQKTLSEVSINVTVNGTTTQAIPYYVSATQLAAILPSATPVGDGKITVTYKGQTSAAADIKVVRSAFGMLTLNQAGYGPAAAFNGNNNNAYLGLTSAANPGERIVLWGTGLGPAAGDETAFPFPQEEMSTPIEVLIGGKPATVRYHGRSEFPGLDQINVDVPEGVAGCYVSVVVRSGDYTSNSATIPVAASGRTCSDPASGLSAADIEGLYKNGTFSIGSIVLGRTRIEMPPIQIGPITVPGSTQVSDFASASFLKFTPAEFNAYSGLSQTSIEGCVVYNFRGQSARAPEVVRPTYLDAGPSITLTLPGGATRPMPRETNSGVTTYSVLGSDAPTSTQPLFLNEPGQYRFDNGAGGADVKTFVGANITKGTPLTWTNKSGITEVNRSTPLPVTWTGGSGTVQIIGLSFIANQEHPDLSTAAMFLCTAPASAQAFTVSPAVLSLLPATEAISTPGGEFSLPGTLLVSSYTDPVSFTAPGVDKAFVLSYEADSKGVQFK